MSPLALSLRFLQTQSDAQLAALARAGHERAFEALVRRHRRPLLSYCRRVGSGGSHAEDTLQQALLQAWSALRSGAEVRDPRAWLYRIVHNVAVSNERRSAVIPVELNDAAWASGADDEVEQRMAARQALAGLAALPHLQREVMVGTAVDGMSHEEVASALGLSSGAVRGLIYRARATLRAAAAAITPGPIISWALRSGSGPSAGLYEALAGGGSAGIGGLLVKGGVIAVTAGAIATATGIPAGTGAVHHRSAPAVVSPQDRTANRPGITAVDSRGLMLVELAGSHVTGHGGSGPPDQNVSRGGSDRPGNEFVQVPGLRDPKEGNDGSDSDGSGEGDRGSTSGTAGGRRSGHEGSQPGPGSSQGGPGSRSGSGSGSGSAPSAGSVSVSGGPDGSHPASSSTTTTGGSGSSSSGELPGTDGASSSLGSSSGKSTSGSGSALATVSSDGGGGGSGSDGGMTTTTTAATTPDDDGSPDAGHRDGM